MSRIVPIADWRAPRAPAGTDALASGGEAATGPLADTLGRRMHDLRISVTDRCNFRCVYCMPKDVFGRDYPFLPHAALLTFEEIARVARRLRRARRREDPADRRRAAAAQAPRAAGRDARAAAGRPHAHHQRRLLARKAQALADAGLKRVTVSLDALDDATFRAMNDTDLPVAQVLDGIDAAARAGLAPIKVNMVVKRGVNEHAIVDLARRFRGTGHIVRFIEYMDVGATNGWRMDDVVPAAEIAGAHRRARSRIEPVDPNYAGEVAERWRYRDGAGEIGVIASVTQAFCRDCTRMRLVDRRQALHLPLRDAGPRPARAPARRRRRCGARAARSPRSGAARRPLLGAAHRGDAPRAQDRDVVHRRLTPIGRDAEDPDSKACDGAPGAVPADPDRCRPAGDLRRRRDRRARRGEGRADRRRASADALRRQAGAPDDHDAGRRARGARDRLPAQPAAGRVARGDRRGAGRLGDRRGRGQDALGPQGPREEDRQAHQDDRLRPGHRVRRPDGRDRPRQAAGRRDAHARRALRPARPRAAARDDLQAGRRGARLRARAERPRSTPRS